MKSSTRNLWNRVLNLSLLWAGAFLLGSGWIMDQRLPRGRTGHGMTLLGMSRHDWGDLHAWVGYAVGVLVVAHLALHSAWLERIAASHRKWPLVAGFGAAAVLLAAFAFLPIHG